MSDYKVQMCSVKTLLSEYWQVMIFWLRERLASMHTATTLFVVVFANWGLVLATDV